MKNVSKPTVSAAAKKSEKTYGNLGAITEMNGRIVGMNFGTNEETNLRYANIRFAVDHPDTGDDTEYFSLFLNGDVATNLETKNNESSYVGGDISVVGRIQTSKNVSAKDGKEYTNKSVLLAKKTDLPAGKKSLVLTRPEYDIEF